MRTIVCYRLASPYVFRRVFRLTAGRARAFVLFHCVACACACANMFERVRALARARARACAWRHNVKRMVLAALEGDL